jgi:hypothetical protein
MNHCAYAKDKEHGKTKRRRFEQVQTNVVSVEENKGDEERSG